MPNSSFQHSVGAWAKMSATVEARKGELPHLHAYAVALEAQRTDLIAEQARRQALLHQCLESTATIRAGIKRGKELEARIRNGLRSQYGSSSEKLKEFGIRRFRGGNARKTERKG